MAGRPTKYKPEFASEAKALCENGATNSDLAKYFGVAISTINLWGVEFSDFSDALKEGKSKADDIVENALYKRAIGFSADEDDIRVIDGKIVVTPTTKHYPPDTTAAIFWLKNRRKDQWREKQEHGFTDNEGQDIMPPMLFVGVKPDGEN